MEGKPVTQSRDPALDEFEEANLMLPETPRSVGTPDELPTQNEPDINDEIPDDIPKKKPAILGSEGTSMKVALSVRPPKKPLPKTLKRKYRGGRSARSIASSLKSAEILLPDERVYSQYDEAIADINGDLENVQTAMGAQKNVEIPTAGEEGRKSEALSEAAKSVHDMLEEAKRIVTPGAEPVHKMKKSPRRREQKKDVKKTKATKGEKTKGKKDEDTKDTGQRTERTVDEIIASLRSQSRTGQQSEADRKIQEIMDRVMSRSSGATGESTAEDKPEQEMEDRPISISLPQTPLTGDSSSVKFSPYFTPSPGFKSVTPDKREGETKEPILEEAEDKPSDEQDIQEAEKYLEERMKAVEEVLPPAPPSTAQRPPEVEPLIGLSDSDSEEEKENVVDIDKAWEDLNQPDVTNEMLVGVMGSQAVLEGRHPPLPGFKTAQQPVYSNSVSFLSAWKPVSEKRKRDLEDVEAEQRPSKSVHHFCTMTTEYQLPEQFVNIGRKYHTPSRFEFAMPDQRYRFGSRPPSVIEERQEPTIGSAVSDTRDVNQRRISAAARRVLQKVEEEEGKADDSVEAWQKRAEEVFETPQFSAEGSSVPHKVDESRLYWSPAPPKLDVAPAKVKDILFPEYQRPTAGVQLPEMQDIVEESSSSEEEIEETEITEEDREQMEQLERILLRRYKSTEDLTEFVIQSRQREKDIEEGKLFPYEERLLTEKEKEEKLHQQLLQGQQPPPSLEEREPSSLKLQTQDTDSDLYPTFPLWRRSSSAPDLNDEEDDTLMISQDYNVAMDEIQRQKRNIREWKHQQKLEQIQQSEADDQQADDQVIEEETIDQLQRVDPQEYKPDVLKVHTTPQQDEPTPAELALAAGRAYVILPKKKKKKPKSSISMARLDEIENFLRKKPRKLARCESMIKIPKPIERELRVPQRVREGPRRSLPDIFNFDQFGKKRGLKKEDDTREWVRDIWNVWFDEVFPPTPEESDYEEEEILTEEQIAEREEEERKKRRKDSLSSSIPVGMEYIEPLTEDDDALQVQQIIMEEIEKLTGDMNKLPKPKAFDFCRRGALYRKIGYMKAAEDDLSRAIMMEPLLLDAYWHRHLLYVLQDRKKEALDDLTFILKHSKTHAGAYRSMAEIYKRQDDITMAIVNYTQAIKLNPRDHEAYYARAECYEKRGDMLLALEDYSSCTKIAPTRIDAILKHGMYYFDNKSWGNAINDFTDLLRVDPLNASARVLRGRAYAAMGQWSPAVEDLSAAIHLDPHHWEAFYHRACILRKAHPKRALHDYSVSLLINDSEENVSSYLHRGILYNAMGRPEDATPDFESVLKLNKDNACAHVNLGLIMMNHYDNYHRAIKRFTSAIKVDPTYVRAYVCRGEAYHKIHELRLALRDFTRAIHLKPDVHHYYMYRGQLLLELGNLELAAFCVRHASEISSGSSMGQRPTQQAVVYSFLKNYDKAIDALRSASRSNPSASMYMLLGKTQMKAKKFENAISSFQLALSVYKPWKARDPWPIEAGDAHYLIGQCSMELRQYMDALNAFTDAIKLNPNMAEALYHRGMARMKLKMSKGIQDFNRALAINPTIFQAYLSRACFYGIKGNYTKAILNCNEAIKLQPNSVRAYLYRGALKYHIKAYELAIRDLSKAASIDSSCGLAYFNRAVCYQENKDYQKALTDYGIVLLLGDSLKLKVLINRGLLYFEKKDYTNALYDFKMSANMNPRDHKILHTLGLCYHKLGRLQEAVKTFTLCVESQPFFLDGILARGNVYMDYGHEQGLRYAMRDYERVLRYDPYNLPARVNLAYTLQVSGHFMQAWRQFTIAIDMKPNFKPALEGRSIINLQMSDTFASYQDINAAIKVNPTAELLTNRGVIYQFMDDRVNAMSDYRAALELDPTYSLAYFNAGNVYFHTRQFSQALEYFTLTVKYNCKDESAFLNRAITKVMLKDAKGALEDFKSALKLSPHSAHMYLNRGNLYASTQQYEKAEKDYTKALDLHPDDPQVLKRRADVRGKLGKKDLAIHDYRQAIELQGRISYIKANQ
ncbi:cytochrome c oxidase subunit 1 [Mactra antiquata]